MGIDAALGRIQQILALQQQIFDPGASAASATAASPAASTAASATAPTTSGSFAGALAAAQATTGGVGVNPSGYVNPLANASVRPERIDQGVDYAGSGTLGAIGPGVVTQVVQSGSGWEGGGYVEYRLTAGPYAGKSIYYAEGVSPTVTVGQTLNAGDPVATIIPGGPHGIELGFASGRGFAFGGGMAGWDGQPEDVGQGARVAVRDGVGQAEDLGGEHWLG